MGSNSPKDTLGFTFQNSLFQESLCTVNCHINAN